MVGRVQEVPEGVDPVRGEAGEGSDGRETDFGDREKRSPAGGSRLGRRGAPRRDGAPPFPQPDLVAEALSERERRELIELADDLLADDPDLEPSNKDWRWMEREELFSQLPPEEPPPPTMYEDCRHPRLSPDYSVTPAHSTVVPLDREKYATPQEADARFAELAELRGLQLVGERYYTARHWCYRCVRC